MAVIFFFSGDFEIAFDENENDNDQWTDDNIGTELIMNWLKMKREEKKYYAIYHCCFDLFYSQKGLGRVIVSFKPCPLYCWPHRDSCWIKRVNLEVLSDYIAEINGMICFWGWRLNHVFLYEDSFISFHHQIWQIMYIDWLVYALGLRDILLWDFWLHLRVYRL